MKIGFVVYLGENEDLNRAPRYPEIRRMAQAVEEAGLDSIWLYDHLLFRWNGQPTIGTWESWTMLSALAETTQRVELGSLVLCNPFRNPAILAKMAVTLDEVSGGRFILGLGAGWNKAEFDAFGIPFDHRVDRLEEALQIVRPLLKQGHVNFEGAYYQTQDCEITPSGPRPDGPPLLIGGHGPRMLHLTAQYGDIWNTDTDTRPDLLAESIANLHTACMEVGRDPATLVITARVGVAFPDIGKPPGWMKPDLPDSVEEIATALHQYEALGVSHLMFDCGPSNEATLAQLAKATRLYRGNSQS